MKLDFNVIFLYFFISFSFKQQTYQLPSTESSMISLNSIDNKEKFSSNHIPSYPIWPTTNGDFDKNDHQSTDLIADYLLKRRQEFSVTGTPKPTTTNLNDLFITVKTTKSYHDTRLALIIKTWFQLAKDQVSLNEYFLSFFFFFLKLHISIVIIVGFSILMRLEFKEFFI